MKLRERTMTLALFTQTGGRECERCANVIAVGAKFVQYGKYRTAEGTPESLHAQCYAEVLAEAEQPVYKRTIRIESYYITGTEVHLVRLRADGLGAEVEVKLAPCQTFTEHWSLSRTETAEYLLHLRRRAQRFPADYRFFYTA